LEQKPKMAAPSPVRAPTPAQVDAKASEYFALKDKLLEATLAAKEAAIPLDQLKEELIVLVREFGSVHAEKSKLLHGITREMMVTFGSTVSIDGAAVERFRLALVKANQARLLKKVFLQDVRWSLSPEASAIVKAEKLSKPLLALYSQVEVVKSKSPSLQVREKSA
jgi:hypothetical protein